MKALFGGFLVVVFLGTLALGQDRVTVQLKDSGKPIVLSGQILDYTGNILTVRLANGTPQIVDRDRVLSLETYYEPVHLEALAALEKHEHAQAREKFEAALQKEMRDWVKREILAGLIRISLREGDLLEAARRFLKISESDPVTRFWGLAPLIWGPTSINSQMTQQARGWLAGELADARLIGASWLLLDPVYTEAAQSALQTLSRGTNERLTALSRAQLWRVALTGNSVSEVTLKNWSADVERLPAAIRGGPQSLIARGFWQLGDLNTSVEEFLKVPLILPENEALAARCLLQAAEGLEQTGLQREAQTLYYELVVRYSWSREGGEAARRLDAMTQGRR